MKKKKILIIDDERDILDLFERVLPNHCIQTAENGTNASKLMAKEKFDIIFLDMVIPNSDSIEILKTARKISPRAKVILMTGFAVEDEIAEGFNLGAVGVMHKPFDHIDDLKNAVERFSGKRKK